MRDRTLSVNASVRRRAHNRCEKCGVKPPLNPGGKTRGSIHHRMPRRVGGPDTIPNLVLLCLPCHYGIHSDEELAELDGWIVWDYPESAPLNRHFKGWVLLLPDGTLEHLFEPPPV